MKGGGGGGGGSRVEGRGLRHEVAAHRPAACSTAALVQSHSPLRPLPTSSRCSERAPATRSKPRNSAKRRRRAEVGGVRGAGCTPTELHEVQSHTHTHPHTHTHTLVPMWAGQASRSPLRQPAESRMRRLTSTITETSERRHPQRGRRARAGGGDVVHTTGRAELTEGRAGRCRTHRRVRGCGNA